MKTYNWEITTGCTNLGGGCESCPSMWEAKKTFGIPGHKFSHGYDLTIHRDQLDWPRSLNSPSMISVSLGSDLLHEDVPDDFIQEVFNVMRETPHRYEMVTKRAERLKTKWEWPENLNVGVTVESEDYKWRIDYLRGVPVTVKFISMVPILGPMGELDLAGISFVGVKAESWGLKRHFDPEWLEDVYRQCEDQGVNVLENYFMYADSVGA